MKKQFKLFLLTTLIAAVAVITALSASAALPGKTSDWATEVVSQANSCGIVPRQRKFGDFTTDVTRAEIAEVIVRAYENATGETVEYGKSNPFDDTNDKYCKSVYKLGIMSGTGEGKFSPYDKVTRAQMAKIILNLKAAVTGEYPEEPGYAEAPYTDFYSMPDWAKPYVAKVSEEKIMRGYDDGSFRADGTISLEESLAVVIRTLHLNEKEKPVITSVVWDSVISTETQQTVEVFYDDSISLVAVKDGSVYDNTLGYASDGEPVVFEGEKLETNSIYYLYAVQENVISEPIKIYTDNYSLNMEAPYYCDMGNVTVRWNRVPGVDSYALRITEQRNSYYDGDIAPNTPQWYEIKWEDYFTFYANPNRTYTVEIYGNNYYDVKEIYVRSVYGPYADEIWDNYPSSAAQAKTMMTTVQVPVWRLKNGKKYSSTAYITVNSKIADVVVLIFEEIYNGPEQFPIRDVGGYSWRNSRSEHNCGTAIDINANENYCLYSNGTVVGSHWKPYEDPYSITPYGDVMRAFEKYGFSWGGDSWPGTKDYMHFSYMGT